MKRMLLAVVLLVTMGFGALTIFADSPETNEFESEYAHMNGSHFNRNRNLTDEEREIRFEERQERFEERQDWAKEERQEWMDERGASREERIEDALQEGKITEEEATERRAELKEQDQFHRENEFSGRGFHHGRMRKGSYQRSTGGCHF